MIRGAAVLVCGIVVLAPPAGAQSLAARIAAVRDGNVHLSFAARPGLCGDGDNGVRSGRSVWMLPNGFGHVRDERFVTCYAGPVRVSVRQSAGEIASVNVHVGGRWSTGDEARDLGVVSAPEAAHYFATQARTLREHNAEFAIAAAALADSVVIATDFTQLARAADVRVDTRGYVAISMTFGPNELQGFRVWAHELGTA